MFSSARVVAASNSPNFRVSYIVHVRNGYQENIKPIRHFCSRNRRSSLAFLSKNIHSSEIPTKIPARKRSRENSHFPSQTFFPRLAPSSSVGQQTQVSGKESEVRFARKKSSLFEKAALGPHFASVFLFDLLGGRGSEKLSNWRKIHNISRIFDIPVVFISNGKKCGRKGRGHVTIC